MQLVNSPHIMDIKEMLKRVHRSRTDQMLGGVCAGFAEATDLPPWVWRAGFAFMALWLGTGLFLYVVLWVVLPE